MNKLLLISMFLILTLFYPGGAFAQDNLGASEEKGIGASDDPIDKARHYVQSAEDKIDQIKPKMNQGNTQGLDTLTAQHEQDIKEAKNNIDKAKALGKDTTSIEQTVEEATAKHIEVLKGVLGKVPDQAKDAIRYAIEVSQKGQQKALENLQKQKGGSEKVGRPEGMGNSQETGSQGVGQPRGVGGSRMGVSHMGGSHGRR